jgi:sodium/bile acid cotransporter 7
MSTTSSTSGHSLRRFIPDSFTLSLLATVLLASVLPVQGDLAVSFGKVTTVAIGLLFFLHGAKLSKEAVVAGLTHWRLHALVLATTFVVFPLLGLLIKPVALLLVSPDLYLGILFLCLLPSTVQSSIGMTSMAKGNVAAAICSASASNFLGIFITPLLVGLVIKHGAGVGFSYQSIMPIVFQLLLPFIAGQLMRPLIGPWVDRHKAMLKYVDQGSILLVVFGAFSEAVVEGLWHQLSAATLAGLLGLCLALLAACLVLTTLLSRKLGFGKEDEIAIVFCGSKKSMASGVPMAKVLFASGSLGMIILPLMLFHQAQLMVCAALAQRYARRPGAAFGADSAPAPNPLLVKKPPPVRGQKVP